MEECPVCGGLAGILGVLGNRIIWQCRDCGWEWDTAGNEEADEASDEAGSHMPC